MTMVINGSGTITGLTAGGLPDATITQAELAANVAGNGPAFSAYQSSTQTLTSNVTTKIQFQTENWDTASAYNNTGSTVGTAPAYSFNPQVAGYYQITAGLAAGATVCGIPIDIYKNGSSFKQSPQNFNCGGNAICAIVYLNGSTDYIEIYGAFSVGQTTYPTQANTYFQAAMVRAV